MVETRPYRPENPSAPEATALEETLPNDAGRTVSDAAARVGRYTVLGEIGAGGMGVVYKAYDPELHREVAIKVLSAGRSANPDAAERRRARLLREARAMAQLAHPNVIRVYDVGPFGEGVFMAMEFVIGKDARKWLSQEKPSWRRVLGVFRAAGRGLAAAHNAGLVHRDFKPANVLVGDDGRVRVLDFGLARTTEASEDEDANPRMDRAARDALGEALTEAGTVLGTPVYMAPEQHAGQPADPRSDQFSFCVALYHALYRKLPYAGQDVRAMARAKFDGRIESPPEETDVPPRLFAAIRRGLSPEPNDRFASMPALLRELRTIHTTPEHGFWPRLMIAASAASMAALLALAASHRPGAIDCGDLDDSIDEVWSAERRASVRSGLAEPTGERLAAAVDRYADAWTGARRRSCEAGESVDPCFRRARTDLDAVLRAVERGEGPTRAPVAVAELEAMLWCPPKTPGQAEDGSSEALAQALLGGPEDGQTESEAPRVAVAQAATMEPAAGAERLRAAYFASLSAGDTAGAALTSTASLLTATEAEHWDDARDWLPHARALAEAFGRPPRLLAEISLGEAALSLQSGDLEASGIALDRTVSHLAEMSNPGLLSLRLQALRARWLEARGDAEKAIELLRAGLSAAQADGWEHPRIEAHRRSLAAFQADPR